MNKDNVKASVEAPYCLNGAHKMTVVLRPTEAHHVCKLCGHVEIVSRENPDADN